MDKINECFKAWPIALSPSVLNYSGSDTYGKDTGEYGYSIYYPLTPTRPITHEAETGIFENKDVITGNFIFEKDNINKGFNAQSDG